MVFPVAMMSSVDEAGIDVTIQWRQYANLGSSGVGASGSIIMNVKVEDDEDVGVAEMLMTGSSLIWVTRARLPFSGESPEGNLTARSRVGVKESGMMDEGRRFALLSESTMEGLAMMVLMLFFSSTSCTFGL